MTTPADREPGSAGRSRENLVRALTQVEASKGGDAPRGLIFLALMFLAMTVLCSTLMIDETLEQILEVLREQRP